MNLARLLRGFLATGAKAILVLAFLFGLAGPARSRQSESSNQAAASESSAPLSDRTPAQEKPSSASDADPSAMPRMIIDMTPGDVQLEPHPEREAGKLSPWVKLGTVSLSTRYNFVQNSAGSVNSSQGQYQAVIKAAFRFDSGSRYTMEAGLFPGNRFSSGWNGSGWGSGDFRTNLYLKQLYFDAKPVTGLELQYGGLYFNQGASTEITGYDYDAYLAGERIRLTRPANFFFDEISITYAYVNAADPPSISKRFHRLQQSNYHQFLVAKNVGERLLLSADYTSQSGVQTVRQALRLEIREIRLVDFFHFENYQVANPNAGYGFAAYGEKKLHTKLSLGGGYAQHDRPGLYSDRFAAGKRIFVNVQLELTNEFSISTSYTQAIRNASESNPRTRLDVALNYDLLRTLRRAKVL